MSYVKLEDAERILGEKFSMPVQVTVMQALRSLPTDDGVTDEMVAERLRSLGYTRLEFQLDSTGGHEATYYTAEGCERMGLGPLPAPPAC